MWTRSLEINSVSSVGSGAVVRPTKGTGEKDIAKKVCSELTKRIYP